MSGQFPPESRWSVSSGKLLKSDPFRGGQFAPESGGQFDRILHAIIKLRQDGLSLRKIAKEVGIHHCTVAEYLIN